METEIETPLGNDAPPVTCHDAVPGPQHGITDIQCIIPQSALRREPNKS